MSLQDVSIVGDTGTFRKIMIPCCLCGAKIYANAANQCGACLAQQFDLKALLQTGPSGGELCIHQCRRCRRFERQESRYDYLELESAELLAVCLKKIPALQRGSSLHGSQTKNVHLVDAAWVWTEAHSMRLKLRLTVRAEVAEASVTIQQRVMVEFKVKFSQCKDCNREFTNRTWQAILQLRQKRQDGSPRKGLIMLEMALAKNKEIRKHVVRIDTTRHGFDFYFLGLTQAQNFSAFLARISPMRAKTSSKLVSTDVKSNTANIKHTISCEMVPLCRDDLVIADRRVDGGFKLSGRLCLVNKMSSMVHFVDASPARGGNGSHSVEDAFADLHAEKYWKAGGEKSYRFLLSSQRMVRFVVLDVELCEKDRKGVSITDESNDGSSLYAGPSSGLQKYALADVEVVREGDFGKNDESYFSCVTHLGNLIQPGDIVLGYDLESAVFPSSIMEEFDQCFNSSFVMPDVVLVKKIQGDKGAEEPETKDESKPEPRAKSSGSKKRERRMRKEKKKLEALEDATARMGFGQDAQASSNMDESSLLAEERAAFEEDLKNDPELAQDLQMAEQELLLQQDKTKDEESIVEGHEDEKDFSDK